MKRESSPNSGERQPLRVLVVRVGAMGDVLHGMPAVAALRGALPKCVLGWAIEPHWSPLLCAEEDAAPGSPAMPLVDRVHAVPAKAWSRAPFSLRTVLSILRLRRELRRQKYDLAVDLQGSIRSAIIAWMSGAKRVVGSDRPRERPARWFYRKRVRVTRQNVVEQAAEIVSAAVGVPLEAVTAPLPSFPGEEEWCDTLLSSERSGKLVFLAPTAGWGAKEWPAVRYGHLAEELSLRGYTVLVNASPVGTDAVANLVAASSRGAACMVPCNLPQLITLVRRVHLVIAGDTGPLHLAAAAGIPALGLFGPTDPRRTGPWGTQSSTLRHRGSITSHRRHADTEPGLLQIQVKEVLAEALSLLR